METIKEIVDRFEVRLSQYKLIKALSIPIEYFVINIGNEKLRFDRLPGIVLNFKADKYGDLNKSMSRLHQDKLINSIEQVLKKENIEYENIYLHKATDKNTQLYVVFK